MPNKKKPALSPEAARILEQYRSARSRSAPAEKDGADSTADDKPNLSRSGSPPPAAPQHRSGTRGK